MYNTCICIVPVIFFLKLIGCTDVHPCSHTVSAHESIPLNLKHNLLTPHFSIPWSVAFKSLAANSLLAPHHSCHGLDARTCCGVHVDMQLIIYLF